MGTRPIGVELMAESEATCRFEGREYEGLAGVGGRVSREGATEGKRRRAVANLSKLDMTE